MEQLQTRILDAALPAIVFDGWTFAALESAAKNTDLEAFDAKRAFPNGVADAVALFFTRADAQMVETLRRDHELTKLKIRERIATAVMTRLNLLTPHREAVRRAIAFYALPWNAPAGMKSLYDTVDAMWREAGDTSTDYNFYTKRTLLAAVLKATTIVWLEDTSDNFTDTKEFLDRRIEEVMQIEKHKAKLLDNFSKFEEWLPGFARRKV